MEHTRIMIRDCDGIFKVKPEYYEDAVAAMKSGSHLMVEDFGDTVLHFRGSEIILVSSWTEKCFLKWQEWDQAEAKWFEEHDHDLKKKAGIA